MPMAPRLDKASAISAGGMRDVEAQTGDVMMSHDFRSSALPHLMGALNTRSRDFH